MQGFNHDCVDRVVALASFSFLDVGIFSMDFIYLISQSTTELRAYLFICMRPCYRLCNANALQSDRVGHCRE